METQFAPDFSDYLAAIKRRHFLLLCVALPIIAIAVALAVGLPNVYVSGALIQFSQATISGELPSSHDVPDRTYMDEQRNYADQYVANIRDAVLNSQSLAPVVAKVRGLPTIPSDPDEAEHAIKAHAVIQSVRSEVLDPDSGREREIVPAFMVSFKSHSPQTAHDVAVQLTNAVILASRRSLLVRANEASQFYASEAQRYRGQIGTLESQLADFKAKHFGELPELATVNMGQLDRMQQDLENTTLQAQELDQNRTFLSVQLQQAEHAANSDQSTLERLEAEYNEKEPIYGDNYPDIISLRHQIESLKNGGAEIEGMTLRQQLATEEENLRTLRQRYSEAYPDVQSAERRIALLKQRIARGEKATITTPDNPTITQLKTQIDSVNNQIAGLQAHSAELRRQVGDLQKRLEMTPLIEKQYQQLTSGLDVARTKYEDLMKSEMDSELTAEAIMGGRSDELRVVNQPIVPDQPAEPKRLAIATIGVILALVLAFSAGIGAESVDQTVRGSRDVRRVLALAPLAVIPRIQDALTRRRRFARLVALGCTMVIGGLIAVVAVNSVM